MKQRSIPKMFLLEIVTLGIYRLYWFIKTRRELMERTKVKIPSPLFLLIPLAIVIAAFGFLIASSVRSYSTNGINKCIQDRGYNASISSSSLTSQVNFADNQAERQCIRNNTASGASVVANIVVFVAIIAYLPLLAWWVWHYCEAVEIVTNEKVSRVLGMVLFLVVPDGIDILIIQDYFNKVPAAQGVPQQ